MKYFIDTNVLLNAILFPNGDINTFLQRIIMNEEIVLSTYVIDEIRGICRKKYLDKRKDFEMYIASIISKFGIFESVQPEMNILLELEDKNEDRIIIDAIMSGSDYLITDDEEYVDIDLEKPKIIFPSDFNKIV